MAFMNELHGNAFIYSAESGQTIPIQQENGKKENESQGQEKGPVTELGKTVLRTSDAANRPPSTSESIKPPLRVVKLIPEHSLIFKNSRKLTDDSRGNRLHHFNLKSENVGDVYITDEVVFKPGKEAALKAKIGYGLMRLIGIDKAVVASKDGEATVVSRTDMDVKSGKEIDYAIVDLGSNHIHLLPAKELAKVKAKPISLSEEEDQRPGVYKIAGSLCILEPTEHGYQLLEAPNILDELIEEFNLFRAVHTEDGDFCLAAETRLFTTKEEIEEGQEVEVNNIKYKVHFAKDSSDIELQLEDKTVFTCQKMKSPEGEEEVWVDINSYFICDEEGIEETEFPFGGKEYQISKDTEGKFEFKKASINEFIEEKRKREVCSRN